MSNIVNVDFKRPIGLLGDEKVSLRAVWEELGYKKLFNQWISRNITKNFKENEDFGILIPEDQKSKRGRPRKDYWVTVDTAKKIAMMANTTKGSEVREYFLNCERLVYDKGLEGELPSTPALVSPEFLRQLADELEYQTKRADVAEAALIELQERLINSRGIVSYYPQIAELAENHRWTGRAAAYTLSGKVTMFLSKHGVHRRKTKPAMFSMDDIEAFIKERNL